MFVQINLMFLCRIKNDSPEKVKDDTIPMSTIHVDNCTKKRPPLLKKGSEQKSFIATPPLIGSNKIESLCSMLFKVFTVMRGFW
jgi:hypothetical protein